MVLPHWYHNALFIWYYEQSKISGLHYDNNESKTSNISLILKPPSDLALLFNQFNNAIPENKSDPENVIQIKYDIDKLH